MTSHAHEEDLPGTVNLNAAGEFLDQLSRNYLANEVCTKLATIQLIMDKLSFLYQRKIQMILYK